MSLNHEASGCAVKAVICRAACLYVPTVKSGSMLLSSSIPANFLRSREACKDGPGPHGPCGVAAELRQRGTLGEQFVAVIGRLFAVLFFILSLGVAVPVLK